MTKNKGRDIARLEKQLLTAVVRLSKHKIPIYAVWYADNKQKEYGTKHLKNLMGNMDKDVACKADILNMASQEPDEPLCDIDPEAIQEQEFRSSRAAEDPALLPFPLRCMNKSEKITWITKEILREQLSKTGKIFTKIKYGNLSLRPSFWLEDEWNWILLDRNLSNVHNKMYTGPGDFHEFLTRLIENCLRLRNKDPQMYIKENINKIKLHKKMKRKGVHEGVHILSNENEDAIDDVENDNDIEAPASEYRIPVSPEQNQSQGHIFVPRRNLPDDMAIRFPGVDPAPPAATSADPENGHSALPRANSPLLDIGNPLSDYFPSSAEPNLTPEHFYHSWAFRQFTDPPAFLSRINQPLHEGWKSLNNAGGGPCLFRTGADHIKLKDFRILRRYVHAHICDLWYYYRPHFTFPFNVSIGSVMEEIRDEAQYLTFLMTEESLMSWNTGQAEVVAMGNVLGADIFMLSYNIQGRQGTQEQRTQWSEFKVNRGLSQYNVFWRNSEPLHILHEDESHFTKLVWLPRTTEDPEKSMQSRNKRRGPEIIDGNVPISNITDSKRRKKINK